MKKLLILVPLFWHSIAVASPPAFCNSAQLNSVPCATSADCEAPRPLCTTEANPQLKWTGWTGRCVDPTAAVSSTRALQADLCTIPDPVIWGSGTAYNLPAAAKFLIDDPELDGSGLVVWRRIFLNGMGSALVFQTAAVMNYAVLRIVVPNDNFDFESPGTFLTASYSVVRDLSIVADNLAAPNQITAYLIEAHYTTLENVRCWHGGKCFHVHGGPGGRYNANHSSIYGGVAGKAWGKGFDIHGPDSNGVLTVQGEMVSGTGMVDSSFSGNTHINMSSEGNNLFSNDTTDPVNFNTRFSMLLDCSHCSLVNPYVEGSDPAPNSTKLGSLVIGGTAQARILGPAERVGGTYSKLEFKSGNSPYTVLLGRPHEAIFMQLRPNNEGVPSEIFGQQLRIRNFGTEWFWGWFNEDQNVPAPLRWRSSNVTDERGRVEPSTKLVAESGPTKCCDTKDNDWNGKVDCQETACGIENCC